MRPFLIALVVTLFVPLAAAASCAPSCVVLAELAGYVSPVVQVDSGAAVTWRGLDVPHTATADSNCFSVGVPVGTSQPSTFTVSGGNVIVQVGAAPVRTCPGTPLSGGALGLPYHCALHRAMTGVLVVK